jgi:hypothetical protein
VPYIYPLAVHFLSAKVCVVTVFERSKVLWGTFFLDKKGTKKIKAENNLDVPAQRIE